jgi:hypothetical protein
MVAGRLEARGRPRQNGLFTELIGRRQFRNALPVLCARLDLAARMAMAPATSFAVCLLVLLSLGLGLLPEKRLSIGDGNLVVVRMNFGES